MKTAYCANDPCEAQATYAVVHSTNSITPLCQTCKQAYVWGQVSPEAEIIPMEAASVRMLLDGEDRRES